MAVDESLKRSPIQPRLRSPAEIAASRGPASPLAAPGPIQPDNPFRLGDDGGGPAKKFDPLPQPGEEYRAHARFGDRLQAEQRILHFVKKDWTVEGFAYSDLRRIRVVPGERPGASPSLVLRFVESIIVDVAIRGRHLRDMHHYISLGVLPWVWEYPGTDFEDEHSPVITSLKFEEFKF